MSLFSAFAGQPEISRSTVCFLDVRSISTLARVSKSCAACARRALDAVQWSIYVIGTPHKEDAPCNSVKCYSVSDNAWSDLPPLPSACNGCTIAVLEGRVYVLGNLFPNCTQLFAVLDQQRKSWERLQESPLERIAHRESTVVDGYIYVMGAAEVVDPSGDGFRFRTQIARYKSSGSWEMLPIGPSHISDRHDDFRMLGANGAIYLIGSKWAIFDRYDPKVGQWTALELLDKDLKEVVQRTYSSCVSMVSCRKHIFVSDFDCAFDLRASGEVPQSPGYSSHSCWCYDCVSAVWRKGPPMPTIRHHNVVGLGDAPYVIGDGIVEAFTACGRGSWVILNPCSYHDHDLLLGIPDGKHLMAIARALAGVCAVESFTPDRGGGKWEECASIPAMHIDAAAAVPRLMNFGEL